MVQMHALGLRTALNRLNTVVTQKTPDYHQWLAVVYKNLDELSRDANMINTPPLDVGVTNAREAANRIIGVVSRLRADVRAVERATRGLLTLAELTRIELALDELEAQATGIGIQGDQLGAEAAIIRNARMKWASAVNKTDLELLRMVMEEVGELSEALDGGKHEDPVEAELAQIGGIVLNWLRLRTEQKAAAARLRYEGKRE